MGSINPMSKDTNMFNKPVSHLRLPPGIAEVSEARFRRFLRDLESYERHFVFERTVDAFLDVYSQWKKTRETGLKLRMVMLLFELHRLDAAFQCDFSFEDPHACGR